MFMPGYIAPKQTWQEQKQRAMMRAQQNQPLDLKKRRARRLEQDKVTAAFAERQAKAEAAKKSGATREQIRAIMEGN